MSLQTISHYNHPESQRPLRELFGQKVEDEADSPADLEFAMGRQPNRNRNRIKVGQDDFEVGK